MGVVFKHEDILKSRKKLVEAGLRDISPGVRESVFKILEAWEGKPSEEKLTALIGAEKTKRIKELLKQ